MPRKGSKKTPKMENQITGHNPPGNGAAKAQMKQHSAGISQTGAAGGPEGIRNVGTVPVQKEGGKAAVDEAKQEGTGQAVPLARAPAHRPIWSGTISIGLVNVPIKLYSMTRDRSVSFRLLHKEDGQPLRYERVCIKDDKVVPWEETVKGYEVRKNRFVVFDGVDLKAVLPESDRRIRLDKFVHWLSMDPVYFETTYLLAPDRTPEAYGLLLGALERQGKAGVGRITLRTKEYPAVVHVHAGKLVLTTLRYPDEVLDLSDLPEFTDARGPSEPELVMAEKILDGLTGDFDITEYHDRYRERVEELVKKKLAGEKIVVAAPPKEEVKELMTALRETLEQMKAP